MLDRKVNEFQLAFKKFITRLLILAAIVVFGAIAIAQAPRGESDEQTAPAEFTNVNDAKPIDSSRNEDQIRTVSHLQSTPDSNELDTDITAPDPSAFSTVSEDSLPPADVPDAATNDLIVDNDVTLTESIDDSGFELPGADELSVSDDTDYGLEYTDDESGQEYSDTEAYTAAPELLDVDTETRANPYRSTPANDELADNPGDALEQTYGNDGAYGDELPASDLSPIDDTDLGANDEYVDAVEADEYVNQASDDVYSDDLPAADLTTERSTLEYQTEQDPYSERVARDRSRRDFNQTERIEDNPLPQRYALARKIRSTGRPGPQNLEGPQTPSLTVEKIAPNEVQVGKETQFQIRVRNVGRVPADNVVIRDEVPERTQFLASAPEAQPDPQSETGMLWEVGTINPGDESIVTVKLMPTDEGQIGSVATVSFQASATARARSTKPALAIEHTSSRKVLVGEQVKFTIKLSNPGSGTATNVVLEEDVPSGLSHSSGPKLEYEVGTILPGQTRHLELTLTASQPGQVANVIVARGDAGLLAKDKFDLEVVAPEIQVKIDGPRRRYLEREATFTVAVANPGTATAKNVELVAQLPRGLRFLSTNNSGHYDQSRHAVIWNLEQLPAREKGEAQFKAIAMEMGDFDVRAEAKADRNLSSIENHKMRVEGIAALYFGVADKVDPIEVGGETSYVITVENQGSKTATNIRFSAEIPDGMQPLNGRGATQAMVRGQQVIFDPIAKLSPKAKASFEISVRGRREGDQRIRVTMESDDIKTPVRKEESTRVYTD